MLASALAPRMFGCHRRRRNPHVVFLAFSLYNLEEKGKRQAYTFLTRALDSLLWYDRNLHHRICGDDGRNWNKRNVVRGNIRWVPPRNKNEIVQDEESTIGVCVYFSIPSPAPPPPLPQKKLSRTHAYTHGSDNFSTFYGFLLSATNYCQSTISTMTTENVLEVMAGCCLPFVPRCVAFGHVVWSHRRMI